MRQLLPLHPLIHREHFLFQQFRVHAVDERVLEDATRDRYGVTEMNILDTKGSLDLTDDYIDYLADYELLAR